MSAFSEGDAESGRRATMATVRVNREELVRQMGAASECLRQMLEWLWQPLVEAEVTERGGRAV